MNKNTNENRHISFYLFNLLPIKRYLHRLMMMKENFILSVQNIISIIQKQFKVKLHPYFEIVTELNTANIGNDVLILSENIHQNE